MLKLADFVKKLIVVFAVVLVFAAGGFARHAEAAPVSEIVIEGSNRIGTDFVEALISQRTGKEYNESAIAEDIKKIYATGNFYDVSVEKEVSPSGVKLIYTVTENPVVVDLSFRGNDEIEDDKIEEVITIQKNQIVGAGRIHAESRNIVALYAKDGYGNTEVTYQIEPEAGGVSVSYKIEEGSKEKISSVEIAGTQEIKVKDLKKRIFSSPRRFYSLGQKGLFIKEEIDRDADRIKFAYLDEGYLDAQVTGPQLTRNRKKNSYAVRFDVVEGKKYVVSGIELKGIEPPPEVSIEEALYRMSLKEGEAYGSTKLSSSINLLTSLYTNQGYANVNVQPSVIKQPTADGKPGVFITFVVEKGEVFKIGRVDIVGNDKTLDKVIRREIPVVEGQLFKSGDLSLIRPLVGRLGFFDPESIQVQSKQSETRPDELDITVSVAEASTAQFNLGAGVSSIEDFIFFGSIKEANFFGYGKAVEASANFGDITDTYNFRYSDRNFLDTDWTFDISLHRIERDYVDYDTDSTGTTIGIGKSIYRQLWGRVYHRWEQLAIANPTAAAAAVGYVESKGIISAVGADISWDNRDNYQFPTSGYRALILYEHSGPFGGDTNLSKMVFEGNSWVPIFRGAFLFLKVRYDRIFLRGGSSGNSHAADERLFLGGSGDLRGYDYRQLRIPALGAQGQVVGSLGGTERIFAKADLAVPIIKSLGLYGVLFYGMGNVFGGDQNGNLVAPLSINPDALRKDYGYGFWWRSPLGLIKIEIGYPIDRQPFEERKQINFSIGASF